MSSSGGADVVLLGEASPGLGRSPYLYAHRPQGPSSWLLPLLRPCEPAHTEPHRGQRPAPTFHTRANTPTHPAP